MAKIPSAPRVAEQQRVDSGPARIFLEPPHHIIQAFLDHVRQTGCPETFPGIYTQNLDKNEHFIKLKDFEVSAKKRPEGDMAPCPMCHSSNKFIFGELVYLPDRKMIAAIGHECADPKTRAAADQEYRARVTKDREETFLLRDLPRVPAMLLEIERFKPPATAILFAFRQIRRKAKTIHWQLRQVKKQGGRLTVMERVDGDVSAIGPDGFGRSRSLHAREVTFGPLHGAILAMSHYNPVAELSDVHAKLAPHAGVTTEEAALERIVAMSDLQRRQAYADVHYADSQIGKCIARMREFVQFFDRQNIERIAKWASHPEHPDPFTIRLIEKEGMVKLLLKGVEQHVVVELKEEMFPPERDH